MFDPKIKYSEDIRFLTEVVLARERIGFLADTQYNYRSRADGSSAVQTKVEDEEWYSVSPKLVLEDLVKLSRQKYGRVIEYVQYIIAYDYQWRVRDMWTGLDPKIKAEYIRCSRRLLREVEDHIILEQKSAGFAQKIETLNFKYGRDITKELSYRKHALYFRNLGVVNLKKAWILELHAMNFDRDSVEILGTVNLPLPREDFEIFLVINDEKQLKLDLTETGINKPRFLGREYGGRLGFRAKIGLGDVKAWHFEVVYKKAYRTKLMTYSTVGTKIAPSVKGKFVWNGRILYHYKKHFRLKPATVKNRLWFCLRFYKCLLSQLSLKEALGIWGYRTLATIMKKIKRREIWLLSDRTEVARDNAAQLFKYLAKIKPRGVRAYFVLNKNAADFAKMQNYGKVVANGSLYYKLLFLAADKIISSAGERMKYDAFGRAQEKYLRDLYQFNFVCLQHGVTDNDISGWLNCYQKNWQLFTAAGRAEYQSLLGEKYGFGEKVVKLTGFARYDRLADDAEKLIVLMPTWRQDLALPLDQTTGTRGYSEKFKDSGYFQFWNKLINDRRLLAAMEQAGYRGELVVHPAHEPNWVDFAENECFKVARGFADYQELYRRASLVVSDYSSAVMDFAYLKKPILYAQFDREEFYRIHTYSPGYFDYRRDGFGPVTKNYEDTIAEMIKIIEQGCKMAPKYKKRVEKFFAFFDRKSCERIYREIWKLPKKY